MAASKQIKFKIDHLDPLGQGVFKKDDQIYFIPKTLPTEQGVATVRKSSKGVNFASLDELEIQSPERISPFCQHFSNCQGCQFQHCSYQQELLYKKASLQKHFQNVAIPDINIVASPDRKGYRNRIQLHYNLKQNQIGFINSFDKGIVPIANCPLATEPVQKLLQKLLSNWRQMAPKGKNHGHVEISDGIYWNEPYAKGGFSQVNESINNELISIVKKYAERLKPDSLLDLFSGAGNLSNQIECSDKILSDISNNKIPNYIQLDLFDENSLEQFKSHIGPKQFDCLVVDPPRKGFKDLYKWTATYPTKTLLYVSCNPATLVRDLKLIENYQIKSIYLLDMFPSTHHYETFVYLEAKQ